MVAFNVSLLEKFSVIHSMTAELERVQESIGGEPDVDSFRSHTRSLHLVLSSMYQEIGPLQSALQHYHKSVLAVDYRVYRRERDDWKRRRQLYAKSRKFHAPVLTALTS
jgi:hypothetical protein